MDFTRLSGEARDAGQDVVSRLGPDEGLRLLVMGVDVLTNRAFELAYAGVGTALNGALGEQREPALDLI